MIILTIVLFTATCIAYYYHVSKLNGRLKEAKRLIEEYSIENSNLKRTMAKKKEWYDDLIELSKNELKVKNEAVLSLIEDIKLLKAELELHKSINNSLQKKTEKIFVPEKKCVHEEKVLVVDNLKDYHHAVAYGVSYELTPRFAKITKAKEKDKSFICDDKKTWKNKKPGVLSRSQKWRRSKKVEFPAVNAWAPSQAYIKIKKHAK